MSKIFVDLENSSKIREKSAIADKGKFERKQQQKRSSALRKFLIFFLLVGLVLGVGAYFYWQDVKKRPQYSLALLVDAARRDDSKQIQQLVDVDAVVENFVPQVTDKAIELYGRNLAPGMIKQVAVMISPLLPTVKQRVSAEMLHVIREKTKPLEHIPWWAIAIGADKVLKTQIEGDTAYIKSSDPNREFELIMKREGNLWKVVAIKDERLARQVAEKIGQEVISSISREGLRKAGEKFGISGVEDLMKKLEGAF
ncbi:MAG: hypothetical protein D6687_08260 [Acidobacteria bacterium]|jgi:hypothetical protein|nr:MAG: hypothetical protein D6687_08260 [Acidobacteriota bacterium]GIU81501.1 MAG: hypothetical protein KatS3mg006_0565 [Pyrinomonadaceae bacterium]